MLRRSVFFLMFLRLGVHAYADDAYLWPMQAKPALTSTFGEYRGGRLHAAIDLKTWGKEGYPAVAVADGYVWRVRTSPWGYGRAVYVRLTDGRTAIWAHLSGFSKRIEAYVAEEQDRRGTYSVNLFFGKSQLPVNRGEVLGFSGSTGIGVPHLHFELRDSKQRPINPLLHGFDIEDTIPPTPVAAALVPLDGEAMVDGASDPKTFGLTWHENWQRFLGADTITVWGRIGVALRVFDRADASELTNKLAPYRMRMLVDDREVFATTFDVFGYDVTHHGELDRNFLLSQRGLGRFHNLFRVPGNGLPFYGGYRVGDGVLFAGIRPPQNGLPLTLGVHRVRLVVEDVKGNRSDALFTLRAAPMPEIEHLSVERLGSAIQVTARVGHAQRVRFAHSVDDGKTWQPLGKWEVADAEIVQTLPAVDAALYRMKVANAYDLTAFQTFRGDEKTSTVLRLDVAYDPTFACIKIGSDRVLSRAPSVAARFPNGQTHMLPVRQTGLRAYLATVLFDDHTSGDVRVIVTAGTAAETLFVTQQTVLPKRGGMIASVDDRVQARFARGDVYEPVFGRVLIDSVKTDDRMVGSAFRLMPDDVAFEKSEIAVAYPANFGAIDQLGLYTWDDKKGWVFVDNGRDSAAHAVTGEVKHFGVFALMVDDVAPEIADVRPVSGRTLSDRRPQIRATVRDTMSGIWREEDLVVLLNGQRLIVEFDPEEDLIFARPRRALDAGSYTLEFLVRDICGNASRHTSTFTVR